MISTTDHERFLTDWIANRNGLATDAVELDTPLIERGLLDSLHLLDLLLAMEERRGAPLDPAAMGLGAFRDVQTIAARFLVGSR